LRILAVVLGAFPPFPAVTSSGSPLTVARPFRIFTGFLTRERLLTIRPKVRVSSKRLALRPPLW